MLAVDMGSDSLTALGLGVERPEPELMRRPPRPPQQRLLNWRVAVRAYLVLGLLEALALMSIFLLLLHQGGWRYGQPLDAANPLYLYATSASLGTIVLLQVVNVFLCRSPIRSLRDTGLFGNPLILLGVLVEFGSIGLIAYTPQGNAFFGTTPVTPADWLWVAPFAAALLIVDELHKAWRRRLIARRAAGRRR
jgi:magnesium-transporting ATPase (P-type)